MGNDQSSNAVKKADETINIVEEISGEGGQKNRELVVDTLLPEAHSESDDSSSDVSDTDVSDFESDEEDEEEDEEFIERLRILEDAKQLKKLAVAFLHPEKPVEVDATATARCYFDRASAVEQESLEETKYGAMVLADAAALKEAAIDYMHPELGVITSDPTATARCYFDRASAVEQESLEETEERAMALADAMALKKLAVDYMHPELGVITSDPTATARCYFDRASAVEQESLEETEERAMALADAMALKKLAVDYMHPELGVITSDPTATARCYFNRPSAPREDKIASTRAKSRVKAVTKVVETPVTPKHVDTPKSLATQLDAGGIKKSVSRVMLYGLDDEHGDDFY